MAHGVSSVPGNTTKSSNKDQSRATARELLRRFGTQVFVAEHNEFREFREHVGPIDRDGVEAAAADLLAAVHDDLLHLSSPVEERLARELARDRFDAISALIYYLGQRGAKQVQLQVTDGAPLVVCMGDVCRIGRHRNAVQTTQGIFEFSIQGCRSIFPDAVRLSGGIMWPGLCPACRTQRKPVRDQSRALRRRLDAVFAGKTATTYSYSTTIPPD